MADCPDSELEFLQTAAGLLVSLETGCVSQLDLSNKQKLSTRRPYTVTLIFIRAQESSTQLLDSREIHHVEQVD